jgi:AraC-like DNA-binding protein
MDYTTYSPNENLNAFLKCFWTLESPPTSNPEKQRIVPDGCMEMIFHYGDPYKQYAEDGSFIIQPACFVFGQITTALEIEPTGHTGIIAARFHPDGFTPFSKMPIKQMENRAVPLQELFGEEGYVLEREVLNTSTNHDRIKIIEAFLLAKALMPETIDRITKSSVEVMMRLHGQVSVDELSEQLKINRRQLERKFSSAIGLSPKYLAKIIRLQATLKMLEKKQFTSLTSLAYENGYFDQTHFIKDFKEFTGMSPKQFYAGNLKMSALFIGAD